MSEQVTQVNQAPSIFDAEPDGRQQPITDDSLQAAAKATAGHVQPGRMQGKAWEIVPWVYDSWQMIGGQIVHGKQLITEQDILRVLQLFGDKIDKWAYVLHDADVYTRLDEKANPKHVAGNRKPDHYHIMVLLRERLRLSQVAGWFNVPLNQVERKGGKLDTPFIDMVEYMTHRRHPDKAPYDESRIVSNADVHELLLELEKKRALTVKYAKTTEDIQIYCDKIADGTLTLEQVREEVGGFTYSKNERAFRMNRAHYLERVAPLPDYRGNYYISGDSGEGKGVLAFDLACSLAGISRRDMADGDAIRMEEYVFPVSPDERGSISFDGYDGQPVIIWEDITGADACRVLGGVKSTLQALEVHPKYRVKVNVKYGHATLINAVNIFCGTEPYGDFLRGLVGWKKDPMGGWVENGQPLKQTFRRVPVVINVHPTDFDILLRSDLTMDHSGDVMQYSVFKNVRGSYAQIAKQLDGACRDKYSAMLLPPVTEAVALARAASTDGKITDPDADLPDFADFGRTRTGEELEEQMIIEAMRADQDRAEAELERLDRMREEQAQEASAPVDAWYAETGATEWDGRAFTRWLEDRERPKIPGADCPYRLGTPECAVACKVCGAMGQCRNY